MKTKTLAIGLAGAIILLGAGATGAGFIAQGWMAHQVDAWLAAPPFTQASHGALRYALLSGRLEIDDLAVESVSPALRSLRAAQVEIDGGGPGFLFGGGISDSRWAAIRARQVELATADFHASAATLSLSGVSLAGGIAPAAIPDGLAEALERLSADRVELGEAHLRDEAGNRDATVATLAVEHLDKGRCASLSATKSVLAGAGMLDPDTSRIEIAELHLTGVDFLALRPIAAAQGEKIAALVDTMSAAKLTVTVTAGTVSAEGVSLAGLQARPGTWPPSAASGSGPGSALAGLSLDRFELSNLDMVSVPAAGIRLSVAHLALDKLQPGSLGRLAVETVALKNLHGVGRLGSLELAGLAYGDDVTVLGLPHFSVDRLHIADLSAGEKAGAELGIKEAELAMEGGLDNPRGGRFKIGPILVPATLAPLLTAAGYNDLTLHYEGNTRYDAAEGVLEGRQQLTAHEAGALTLSLRFEHYPTALDARDASAMSDRLLEAELAHLELRYDDASLTDRLLKFRAARTGGDVERAREELLAIVEAQRGAFADKPELQASFDAIAGFLRQPRSLTLILAPPKPVALGTLMLLARTSPDQALALLGLSLR
jgi:hypothetical protein